MGEGSAHEGKTEQSGDNNLTTKLYSSWNWLFDKPERLTALSTFAIFFATAVTVCVGIAQWCALKSQVNEMHKSFDMTTEAESPSVYVHGASLDGKSTVSQGKAIESVVEVDFENFGKRAAIVRRIDIDWKVANKLPPEPTYANTRAYSAGIRPTDEGRKPESIRDALHKLSLAKPSVTAIVSGNTFLWIYGFIEIEIFQNRTQRIGFCLRWYQPPEAPSEGFTESDDCPAAYTYRRQGAASSVAE